MTPLRWLWRWCPCEACWRKRHPRPTVKWPKPGSVVRFKTATECEMWGREQALIAEREMRYQLAKAALRDSASEAAFFGVDVNTINASL